MKTFRARVSAERGAAVTLVAILAAGGVLLGMLALSVDVGNMMFERRQLQNGADATAMALAEICAEDPDACDPTAGGTADVQLAALANANAPSDGLHALDSDGRATETNGMCGRGNFPAAMPECDSATESAQIEELSQCPALPSWLQSATTLPYVETYARSESSAGPVLDFFFTNGDAQVVSCARAAWGPLKNPGGTLPVVISACEYQNLVGNPNTPPLDLKDGPKGAWPGYDNIGTTKELWPTTPEVELFTAKSVPGEDCTTFNGKVAPGNFSALVETDCIAEVPADNWVEGSPGNDSPCSKAELVKYRGTVVNVPIFDCLSKSKDLDACIATGSAYDDLVNGGGSAYYHIVGWAAFYLSAWDFSGGGGGSCVPGGPEVDCDRSLKDGHVVCEDGEPGNSERCFAGWFVREASPSGEIDPDGYDLGNTAIVPAG